MLKDIERVLYTQDEIREMVHKMGKQISSDYAGLELVLVGVLKGGFIFLADLIRSISIPVSLDFISVSSYGHSTSSSGIVRIIKDIDIDVKNKHVILVEDIVDTGLTLNHLKGLFLSRQPAGVKICSAFDKPCRRQTDIAIDYKGLEVPDQFIVGYGLDYKEKYRNLPDICILKSEVYSEK